MNTTIEDTRHILQAYLSNHHLASLATASPDGKPSVAIIGYTCGTNLSLVFATFSTSRKEMNLAQNQKVALAIGWENGRSLQYEGIATRLVGRKAAEAAQRHYETTPTIAKYVNTQKQVMYRITPTWMRLIDFHQDPWKVWELDLTEET